MDNKIKETLEKQLQLLSERSEKAEDKDLHGLTDAMILVSKFLHFGGH